jgi:hypothetical protein
VDALSRGLPAVVLLLVVLAAPGCGGDGAPVEPRRVTAGEAQTPALPEGVLLQLYVPDTRELYRIADDGRFLVTPPGGSEQREQPRSKYEPGRQELSADGLARLRKALDEAGFFSLPERIETGDCVSDGVVIRNSGRKVLKRTVVFSARDGGREATVAGKGDFGAPCTLAELEPVYRALDLEALGDWQNE